MADKINTIQIKTTEIIPSITTKIIPSINITFQLPENLFDKFTSAVDKFDKAIEGLNEGFSSILDSIVNPMLSINKKMIALQKTTNFDKLGWENFEKNLNSTAVSEGISRTNLVDNALKGVELKIDADKLFDFSKVMTKTEYITGEQSDDIAKAIAKMFKDGMKIEDIEAQIAEKFNKSKILNQSFSDSLNNTSKTPSSNALEKASKEPSPTFNELFDAAPTALNLKIETTIDKISAASGKIFEKLIDTFSGLDNWMILVPIAIASIYKIGTITLNIAKKVFNTTKYALNMMLEIPNIIKKTLNMMLEIPNMIKKVWNDVKEKLNFKKSKAPLKEESSNKDLNSNIKKTDLQNNSFNKIARKISEIKVDTRNVDEKLKTISSTISAISSKLQGKESKQKQTNDKQTFNNFFTQLNSKLNLINQSLTSSLTKLTSIEARLIPKSDIKAKNPSNIKSQDSKPDLISNYLKEILTKLSTIISKMSSKITTNANSNLPNISNTTPNKEVFGGAKSIIKQTLLILKSFSEFKKLKNSLKIRLYLQAQALTKQSSLSPL